ncbi:MAG TPA: hypothetical protein VGH15_02765 [Caulobacteraceae bacterium]|jgi:hypothetical protein
MIRKSTLLAALGALAIAAPAAAQPAQDQPAPQPSYTHHRHHHHHHYYYARRQYHHGCGFERRYEYGVFGHYKKRWTVGCH